MPSELRNEVARMIFCGAAIAAVAVPIGFTAHLLARRIRPTDPPTEPWHAPWSAFEVIAAFLLLNLVVPLVVFQFLSSGGFYQVVYGNEFPAPLMKPVPVEASVAVAGGAIATTSHEQLQERNTLRMLWAALFALPMQIGLVWIVRNAMYPRWRLFDAPREWPYHVSVAVVAWAILTPLVLTVHAAVNWTFAALDWAPEAHPLTRLASRPALDRMLFVFQACIAAPVVEEIVFRGILLPWLLGNATRTRPVLLAGLVFAMTSVMQGELTWGLLGRGPLIFATVLLLPSLAFTATASDKIRSFAAVYTSSALFAVVHSSVWPSPIPLFVLGLGLGYLTVRTRGLLVPIVVHGLFNGVSALFVLRGAA